MSQPVKLEWTKLFPSAKGQFGRYEIHGSGKRCWVELRGVSAFIGTIAACKKRAQQIEDNGSKFSR